MVSEKPQVTRIQFDDDDEPRWCVMWPPYGFSQYHEVLAYPSWESAMAAATRPTVVGSAGGSFSLAPGVQIYAEQDRWGLR